MLNRLRLLTMIPLVATLISPTAEALPHPQVSGGETPPGSSTPLSSTGLANLIALAHLAGYVRYFHPSDQAAEADWPDVLIRAVDTVEPARTPEELRDRLAEAFSPIAPSLQLWTSDQEAPPPLPAAPRPNQYTFWKHFGVGLQGNIPQNIYSSKRMRRDLESTEFPPAGLAIVKELGGSVTSRIPISILTDETGQTLPRVAHPAKAKRRDFSAADRSTRLADVILAWNVFQHFYPYFGEGGCTLEQWQEALPEALTAGATDTGPTDFLVTLQVLVGTLNDGHGNVFSPGVPFPAPLPLAMAWTSDLQPKLLISAIGPGVEWIQPGDEILAIGGVAVPDWFASVRRRISSATSQWARHRALGDPSFLGPRDKPKIQLRIRRGEETRDIELSRLPVGQPLIVPRLPDSGSEVAPGILYFNLDHAETDSLTQAMERLAAAKGIVFDLRGYPGSAGYDLLGHLTDKTIHSAYWNVPITLLPDQDPEGRTWRASGRWNLSPLKPRLGANGQKIVFLTGGGAISYAESCMGIVEHYHLGSIVGSPTAGTNGNVNPFTLPGGFSIAWTGMKVLKHDRSRHHGVGIQPDIEAGPTSEALRSGKDAVLEAGIRAAQPSP